MTLLNCVVILIQNLPTIVRLIDDIERARADAELDKKVVGDKKGIADAFKNRDPDALRRVFSGS